MKALITRKVGMTSTITEDGTVAAITLLSASDNVVTQIKTVDVDGYQAVQIGFEEDKNLPKPQLGHLKAAKAVQNPRGNWLVESLSAIKQQLIPNRDRDPI